MVENWKSIKDHPFYMISNFGRVFSKKSNRIMKNRSVAKKGYQQITLDGKQFCVHRLVAQAFIPNPNNLPCVNHKDENPSNNNVKNLEWCTYKYNSNYGTNPANRKNQMISRYRNDENWKKDCIERLAKIQVKKRKRVIQLDKNNNYIKTYESSLFTEIDGHFSTHVCDCANGKRKTHHGYKWMWEEEYNLGGALS